MTRRYENHSGCDHPNTKYDREKCRVVKPHAECNHEATPTAARACEDMAKNHVGCTHDWSFSARGACINQQRKKARQEAKATE